MPTPQEELITQKYSAWWAALGYYTINQGGARSGAIVAPTAVTITGNTAVALNTDVTLTANVDPGNVSLPLTYTWSVDGGTITSGAGTAVIEVQWSTSGSKSVSVQVSNAAGTVSDNHTVSVASPLLTDLAVYWPLENLTWTDVVGSASLTNNNGVTVGAPKLGAGSAEFDGTNHLSLADSTPLDPGLGSLSLSFWLKTTTIAFSGLCGAYTGFNGPAYALALSSGKVVVYFNDSGGGLAFLGSSPLAYNDGNWHHIVATFDRSSNTATLFVDSVNVLSLPIPTGPVNPATVFSIGARGTGNFLIGNIDELGIWSRVLTSGAGGEVEQLYNGGSGLSYPFS